MDSNKFQFLLLLFILFSFLLLNLSNAACVPRNTSNDYPIPTIRKIFPPSVSPAPVPSPNSAKPPQLTTPPTPSPLVVPAPASTITDKFKDIAKGLTDIFQTAPAAAPTTNTLIINPQLKAICGQTDYVDLCLASLTPFFKGKTDPVAVLRTAIQAAGEATKMALAVATKMASSKGTDKSTASRLNDCKDSYEDALDNFQSAVEAIASLDIGTINSMLSAVVTDYSTCDDGFIEFNQESLLATYNAKLTKMGSNCLAIASLVKT
ncbi:hypothetical protein ACFE04_005671 [Oxalis oulophora]